MTKNSYFVNSIIQIEFAPFTSFSTAEMFLPQLNRQTGVRPK